MSSTVTSKFGPPRAGAGPSQGTSAPEEAPSPAAEKPTAASSLAGLPPLSPHRAPLKLGPAMAREGNRYLDAEALVSSETAEEVLKLIQESFFKSIALLVTHPVAIRNQEAHRIDRATFAQASLFTVFNELRKSLPSIEAEIKSGRNTFPSKGGELHTAMRALVEELSETYTTEQIHGASDLPPKIDIGLYEGRRESLRRQAVKLDHVYHEISKQSRGEMDRLSQRDPPLMPEMRDKIRNKINGVVFLVQEYRNFCLQGYAIASAIETGSSKDLTEKRLGKNTAVGLYRTGDVARFSAFMKGHQLQIGKLKSLREKVRAGKETAAEVNRYAERLLKIAFDTSDIELYAACAMDIDDSASDIIEGLRRTGHFGATPAPEPIGPSAGQVAMAPHEAGTTGGADISSEPAKAAEPRTKAQKERERKLRKRIREQQQQGAERTGSAAPENTGAALEPADEPRIEAEVPVEADNSVEAGSPAATAGRLGSAASAPHGVEAAAPAEAEFTRVVRATPRRLAAAVGKNLARPVGSPAYLEGIAARSAGSLLRGANARMRMMNPNGKTVDTEVDFYTDHAFVEVTLISGNRKDASGNRISKNKQFDRFHVAGNNPRGLKWILMAPNYANREDLDRYAEKGAIHVRTIDELQDVLFQLKNAATAAASQRAA